MLVKITKSIQFFSIFFTLNKLSNLGVYLKKYFIFYFLSCCFFSASAQKINLDKHSLKSRSNQFYIAEVDDFNENLGYGYFGNNRKQPIVVSGGLSLALKNLIDASFNRPGAKVGINIKIDDLKFDEKLQRGGLEIIGEGKMTLSAYDQKSPDKKFYTTIGRIKYTRENDTDAPDFFSENTIKLSDICLEYLSNYIENDRKNIESFAKGTKIEILPYKTANYGDTVQYKSRRINWSDFKAQPRNNGFAAAIFPSMAIDTKIGVRDGMFYAQIQPKVFMLKNMSWSKKEHETAYSLQHEQLHFDVVYCIMEELKQTLMTIEATSVDDLSSRIQYEYLQAYNKMNRIQETYDSETAHSQNRERQAYWQNKIQSHMP